MLRSLFLTTVLALASFSGPVLAKDLNDAQPKSGAASSADVAGALGMERYIADSISISPAVRYFYLTGGGGLVRHFQAFEPGVRLNFHFDLIAKRVGR